MSLHDEGVVGEEGRQRDAGSLEALGDIERDPVEDDGGDAGRDEVDPR
jgi:hypothetical protein